MDSKQILQFPDNAQPHNEDAERSVIGSILLEPEAIAKVMDILAPDDFYREYCKWIYQAALTLVRRNEPVDQALVSAELERMGMLERANGRAGVANLQNAVPTAANVRHYARIVKDKARERALLAAGRQAVSLVQSPSDLTVDEKIAAAGQSMLSVAMDSPRQAQPTSEIAPGYIDLLSKRMESGGSITGLSSGLVDLDRLTGGWAPGGLVIIAGRPGMGKTAIAVSCALHAAIEKKSAVAIFSMEMSGQELFERMICNVGRVNSQRLRSGQLGQGELDRVYESIGPITEARIEIDDRGAMDEWVIAAETRRLAQKHGGLGLVVIDYIQLMTGRTKTREENRNDEISKITRALKAMAKQLQCPVVALSQLNRGVESRTDKRPQLSDLRDSGSVEQDADIVVMTYRDDYYTREKSEYPGQCELIVAKNRNGAVGTAHVLFRAEHMAFDNLETRRPGGLS